MTAEIRKLRPRRHDVIAQALQMALELPSLSDPARDELAGILERYEPAPPWKFTMLSQEQLRIVLKKINASEKPALTLRVWSALVTYVRDGGEIMASRHQLSEDAETTPQEVSRALTCLVEIGAILRLRPGRYQINPHVGWSGPLVKREAAAKGVPSLQIVK